MSAVCTRTELDLWPSWVAELGLAQPARSPSPLVPFCGLLFTSKFAWVCYMCKSISLSGWAPCARCVMWAPKLGSESDGSGPA